MIDLLLLAKKAANSPARTDLLMAAMHDDERLLRCTMEEHGEHGELLADEFFTPFIGICAAHGSREFWRALGEWGYGFDSVVRHPDQPLEQGIDVARWAACILDPERLSWLMEEGLLAPFKIRHSSHRHAAWEFGMLAGDDQFDFWLGQWVDYQKASMAELTPEQISRRDPQTPMILATLCEMDGFVADADHPYPGEWPTPAQVKHRLDRLLQAFSALHYGEEVGKAQWVAFLERPCLAHHRKAGVRLCQHLSGRTSTPFEGRILDRFLSGEDPNLMMVEGLLRSGAPLAIARKSGLGTALLDLMRKDGDREINTVWDAWIERVQKETPWALDPLPESFKLPGWDHSARIHKNRADATRLIHAMGMAFQAPPASSDRPRTRL